MSLTIAPSPEKQDTRITVAEHFELLAKRVRESPEQYSAVFVHICFNNGSVLRIDLASLPGVDCHKAAGLFLAAANHYADLPHQEPVGPINGS